MKQLRNWGLLQKAGPLLMEVLKPVIAAGVLPADANAVASANPFASLATEYPEDLEELAWVVLCIATHQVIALCACFVCFVCWPAHQPS